MAILRTAALSCIMTGNLACGADLLQELSGLCLDKGISWGSIEAIGAVRKARIGYYDQRSREYSFVVLNRPLELVSLLGNVSLKDGLPFVHAHITLADESLNCRGGHLAEGTEVFACEYCIYVFEGKGPERSYDPRTGLPLWR